MFTLLALASLSLTQRQGPTPALSGGPALGGGGSSAISRSSVAIPPSPRATYPDIQVPPDQVRRDGIITIAHACGPNVSGNEIVRLDDGKGRPLPLRFDLNLQKSLGDPIRFIGAHFAALGKIDPSGTMDVEALVPLDPAELSRKLKDRMGFRQQATNGEALTVKGNQPYLTVLVRYADKTGVTPFAPSFIQNLFSPTYPSLDHYFQELSYGQLNVSGSDVVGWVTLPQVQSYYASSTTGWGVDWDKITNDTLALVDSQVDFRKYYGINIIPNVAMGNIGGLGGQRALTLDGQTRAWGITYDNPQNNMQVLLAHEMGHTLGFPHSSGPYGETYDSLWDVMSNGARPNASPTYGPLAVPTITYNRNLAGWIPANRMLEGLPATDITFHLERQNAPSNTTDFLAAKLYINGSATHYYTIESRRYGGSYEAAGGLPFEGVLINDVDESRIVNDPFTGQSIPGRFAQVVDIDGNGNCNDEGAIWTPGETFTDASAGITVSVLSADATGYNVRVQVAAGKPYPYDITNTNDNGPGSLRNGLGYARSYPGTSTRFKLSTSDPNFTGGVFRIRLNSFLPDASADDTTIDGTAQTALTGDTNPSGPEIFIDGSGASAGQNGIWVIGSRFTMKGVALGNFTNCGVILDGLYGGNTATITGNYFGVAPNGTTAAPNAAPAIYAFRGFRNATIGGSTVAARNVFSGGASCGVFADGAGTGGFSIKGNYFGVTPNGASILRNGDWNIATRHGVTDIVIGGTGSGEGNVISGDTYVGIGIGDAGTNNITIQGNRIGTNAAGTASIPNQIGIYLFGGVTNVAIGGDTAGAANLVSGNQYEGIILSGVNGATVYGNRIGTTVDGSSPLPNTWGVSVVDGSTNVRIGNTGAGQGNQIAGNQYVGVGIGGATTTGNFVQGNRIGIDAGGTNGLPQNIGVYVFQGATNTTIGGSSAARNVIAGHNNADINVSDNTTSNTLIQENYLGTRATGNVGISASGSGIFNAGKNTSILNNVVSGHGGFGVGIFDGATGAIVRGNKIGVGADGATSVPNSDHGVYINNASNNTVGGAGAGEANVIFFNRVGVTVGSGVGNAIRGNRIGKNTALGIDLNSNGVSLNDTGDADAGANNGQNFPVLTSASNLNGSTTIQGTLNSRPNQTYTIDFYASSAPHATSYGEGETYLGSTTVTTNASGNVSFSVPVAHSAGTSLSATATSGTGDTSEFSAAFAVNIATALPISGSVTLQDFGGATAGMTATIELRKAGTSTVVDTKTVTLGADGTFSFTSGIEAGSYDVSLKVGHWLRRKSTNVAITNSGVSGMTFSLINGDVNGDNKIDAADQTVLTAAFRSTSAKANWNANADLNGDGQVSASDQVILGKNWLLNGD